MPAAALLFLDSGSVPLPESPLPEEPRIQATLPQTYEGWGEVVYGDYHVVTAFQTPKSVKRTPEIEVTSTLPEGVVFTYPSQLHVHQENNQEEVREAFMELVKTVIVEAFPEDGAQAMNCREPACDLRRRHFHERQKL